MRGGWAGAPPAQGAGSPKVVPSGSPSTDDRRTIVLYRRNLGFREYSRELIEENKWRAVRYGLYACGWDLMAGPLGFLVTLFSKGVRAAFALVDLSVNAPGKAANALLQGIYRLPSEGVARARRTGTIAAGLIALVSGGVVLLAVLAGIFG